MGEVGPAAGAIPASSSTHCGVSSSQSAAEVCAYACPDIANNAATPLAIDSNRARFVHAGKKASLIIYVSLSSEMDGRCRHSSLLPRHRDLPSNVRKFGEIRFSE